MTYLAAICPDIDVGTAAVILPWHDPLRVAENAAVLDLLSKGRLRFGMGRGLARREFDAFRISMDETRGRFDEAAPMIVNALKTGFMEGDGPYYKQPRIEIRPRPQHSFEGRIYAVASSEDSVDSAAKLGAPRLPGCDLYVTLEPCAMCAGAISLAHLRRLYFAAYAPKSGGVEHGARVFDHPTCHHVPDDLQVDPHVAVDENIPHSGQPRPRDLGMGAAIIGRYLFRGLPDDFQVANSGVLGHRGREKIFPAFDRVFADAVGRIQDMSKIESVAGHSGTASRMTWSRI